MEPDPSPDSSSQLDTKITTKDINSYLGIVKRDKKHKVLYLFSKKVIFVVATITTFIFLSYSYFGLI